MNDYESRKPQIARQITEARNRGDFDSAKSLCQELNSLSTLRFDPTNPEGGASGDWDVIVLIF
jgi:dihydrodipicolinate synthase/N-acetylneuraminate lyase